jgi:hypothetical protein
MVHLMTFTIVSMWHNRYLRGIHNSIDSYSFGVSDMKETRGTLIHLIGQFILAIVQVVMAFAALAYIVDLSPTVPDSFILLILASLVFVIIHALWRIIDNVAAWRIAKAKE